MTKEKFDNLGLNYISFAKLCTSLKGSLNGRKDRFDKSDLIEMAFEEFSNGNIIWADEIGYDVISKSGIKFEIKSQNCSLFTKEQHLLKKNTGSIKLKNTLQQGKKKLKKMADYLCIVDTNSGSLGIVSYDVAMKYSTEVSDGFTTNIPLWEITIIYNNTLIQEEIGTLSYKWEKEKMQRDYVRRFKIED